MTILFYRLLLPPLARFPGPRLAAISRWYEAYYDIILGGQYTSKIAELHRRYDKQYGPTIRISPHELHIIDPDFFDTVYIVWMSVGTSITGLMMPLTVFGSVNNAILGHDAHKAHRNAIAPFFSKPNILARENLMIQNVHKLCQHINELFEAKNSFNLGAAISAFTRDNANEFILGKSYNEIQLKDFGVGLSLISGGAGSFWRIKKHVRWFGPASNSIPVGWMMKVADDGTKSFFRYLEQSEQDTRSALDAASSSKDGKAQKKTERYTMIHQIMDSNLPPDDKTFARVHEEVATVTGAAYETTANTLRLIFYHVYSNDKILQKMRQEFSSFTSSKLLTLKELEHVPYLTAC
ncbi:hypothetical protein HYALB_00009048 [Hymenoscyphus albidus]|uniref:Uncharacterized protein n=1 Tax=Hymenoscyphus albidus TaxID=595503 RepID=A0A9N9LIA3_9HELO|nr:hypothetical protein HYALB_00009048 [Hymenoscyphus albidus]